MKLRTSLALYSIAAALLVLTAVGRIVSTYHVFNQTVDEPFHIASGMEWLDQGSFHLDTEDPVLARIAVAAGPYLSGSRSHGESNKLAEGNAILYAGGHYFRTLALARAGILPFFLLSCGVLWLWCRRLFGDEVALVALLLYTTVPPVLAHAGLATTDMAGGACLLAALYALTRWIEEPVLLPTLALGFCVGLAMLSKFSTLLFLPACALVIIALFCFAERPSAQELLRRVPSLALAGGVALLLVWAGYRFSFGPMPNHGTYAMYPSVTIDQFFGSTSLPAPEFFDGIAAVQLHNQQGHGAWLLGSYSTTGWWYFFPVVLAVKTPLSFLILALGGYGLLFVRRRSERFRWQAWAPGACAVAILAAVMPAHINIGDRHILILYPLLAMLAALATVSLLRQGRRPAMFAAIALLSWQCFASARSHPDYLSYFNELVRGDPARVLSDSDLDWGQDLQRLSDKLKAVGAKQVTLIYFGTADVTKHGLPEIRQATPYQPQTGWVAVSAFVRTVLAAQVQRQFQRPDSPVGWLDAYRPVAHVGKSIDLYYIPPE